MASPPSFRFLDKRFLKPNGYRNLFQIGKILVRKTSTCSRNTTKSLRGGDSLSKYTQSSLGFKNFMKLFRGFHRKSKFLKEAFWLTNMCFPDSWRILDTWMKVNMKCSNHFTKVLNLWSKLKKQRLSTSDVHLKNAMREPKRGKEKKKAKFPWNTWL